MDRSPCDPANLAGCILFQEGMTNCPASKMGTGQTSWFRTRRRQRIIQAKARFTTQRTGERGSLSGRSA